MSTITARQSVHAGGLARFASAVSRETTLTLIAVGVVGLHIVDDNFLRNSTVIRLEAPRLIAWTGRTLGIRAVHVWRLSSANGRTLARTEESYEGFVARILGRPLQKMLDRTLTDGVHHLKVEAESGDAG